MRGQRGPKTRRPPKMLAGAAQVWCSLLSPGRAPLRTWRPILHQSRRIPRSSLPSKLGARPWRLPSHRFLHRRRARYQRLAGERPLALGRRPPGQSALRRASGGRPFPVRVRLARNAAMFQRGRAMRSTLAGRGGRRLVVGVVVAQRRLRRRRTVFPQSLSRRAGRRARYLEAGRRAKTLKAASITWTTLIRKQPGNAPQSRLRKGGRNTRNLRDAPP